MEVPADQERKLRMMEIGDADKANMRKGILLYLEMYPDAADSLNGIKDWWLSKQIYEKVDAESVYQVLEQLIEEGAIKKVSLMDGTILYKKGDK